jgi:trehalose-phosphatase
MTGTRTSLEAAIARVAGAVSLVVAVDFDGTIAPIEARPWLVVPDRRAVDALGALAALPGTTVAVVSARSLADLATQLGRPTGVRLLGSYGTESDAGPLALSDSEARRWAQLAVAFERLAIAHEAAWVERKALGVAFHARGVPGSERLLDAAVAVAEVQRGVHVLRGHEVVEALVRPVSKAAAVDALARGSAADAVAYIGDDHADETVFATLGVGDLGVRVGDAPTAAAHRVPDPRAVGSLLARLAQARSSRAVVGATGRDVHRAR